MRPAWSATSFGPPSTTPHGLRQPVFSQYASIAECLGMYRPSNWTCGRSLCGARPRRTDDGLQLTRDLASPCRQSSMYTYTQPDAGPHSTTPPLRIACVLERKRDSDIFAPLPASGSSLTRPRRHHLPHCWPSRVGRLRLTSPSGTYTRVPSCFTTSPADELALLEV
jgi:hypothetical protein